MTTPNIATATKAASAFDWRAFVKNYFIIGILLLFVVFLSIATRFKFLQVTNLLNIVTQVSGFGLIALGMVFVLIIKGIDLSVGATVALAAVISVSLGQTATAGNKFFPDFTPPIVVPILAAIVVGLICGAINGTIVTVFRIAPFIATLGAMTYLRGGALIYSDGKPISGMDPALAFIGGGKLFGVLPIPVIILTVAAVGMHILLTKTRFGLHVFAIGGNDQAARVSGINIRKVTFWVFVLIGALAGLAGLILAGRIESGNPQLGYQMEMDVITAAVIGGTSFNGGVGTIWGAVIGSLFIGVLNNGMDLLNISPFMQLVVKGVIIIIAIIIDERKNRA
ncbi:MAG: ABC transporter permease [Propionibacteriaceae bacterium]|jgi:inositol transport system permease protein|nr:ABC transporter permease [Propionibacteriaceae bacterium]